MSNKNNEKDNKDLENKESIDEKSLITSDPEDENIEDTEGYINASFKEKLSLKFRKRLISNRMNTFILVLFLIVLFIGVNMFANSKDLAQIDVTENKLYSLTQASKDQLAHLDKDINIYIYGFTEDNVYVNLVKQYAAYSDKIHYEIVTEETNYEVVTKYELSNSNYNAFVVVCGDRDKTLYPDYEFSSYDNETGDTIDITEETITNAILNVSTDDPVKVYFAAGNGEYTTSEITGLITYLEAQVYECEELNLLSVTEIPEDCDILAILDPTEDFNEDEANAVKSYINKGGNIFFGMFKQSETAQFPNLQSILDLYGVTIDFGVLYEGNARNSFSYQGYAYPYILIPQLSTSNDISSEIAKNGFYVIIPWAQNINISEVQDENISVTSSPLLTTSNKCYNVTDLNSQIDTSSLEASNYTIGSSLTRTVTTKNEETGEETETSSKMLVFGNGGFIADSFTIAGMQLSPISYTGNANFALNAFASLAEQEDLITVRKPVKVTNFESTVEQDRMVKIIIFGMPIVIIFAGIVVWNIRRRKR